MLQNDWMAKNKQSRFINLACFSHVTVYTLCVTAAYWLAGAAGRPLSQQILFITGVYVSHWLIDATNAAGRWARIIHQSDTVMVRTMVDQTFHLIIIGLLIEIVLVA